MDGDRIVNSRISNNDWLIINVKQKCVVVYNNDVNNLSEIHKNNLNEDSPNVMINEDSYMLMSDEYDEPTDSKLFVAYTYLESKGKITDQGRTYVHTDPKSCVKDWLNYIDMNGFNNDKGLVITKDIKVLNEDKAKPYTNTFVNKDGYLEIVCKAKG